MSQPNGQPFPFILPMNLSAMGSSHHQQDHVNEVPARVRLALEFLDSITYKGMTRAYPHGMGCETVDGSEILPVERAAQAAALNMLHDYFSGVLTPSHWEAYHIHRLPPAEHPIPCPVCKGMTKFRGKKCSRCDGSGILVWNPGHRPVQNNPTEREESP